MILPPRTVSTVLFNDSRGKIGKGQTSREHLSSSRLRAGDFPQSSQTKLTGSSCRTYYGPGSWVREQGLSNIQSRVPMTQHESGRARFKVQSE